ncbi:vesicular glutamate transporter [Elysia marginata]|uniref:Vesicular glutamate transporter n=1 Tax=Elysia marginata TaxID=1093978 RepID=A0AAV4FF07_9GAST|nr:vesicular glutamate transporter [Elysia marginata]
MVVFMSFGSVLFDMLIKKRLLSVTKTRKLAQFLGYGVQGGCTLAMAFVDDYKLAFILLCVGAAFSAFAISGFQTNPLDLAPQYAGPLTGIARTGMLGAVVSTSLAAQLPGRTGTLESWQKMFMIGGILHLGGVVFYILFASGERQSWAPDPNAVVQRANGPVPPEEVYDDHFADEVWKGAETDPLFPGRGGATGYAYNGNGHNVPASYGVHLCIFHHFCKRYHNGVLLKVNSSGPD